MKLKIIIISLFLLVPLVLFSQTSNPTIGDGIFHTVPIGTKYIDIGFVRNDFVNMHYVNYTDNLLLRWKNNRWRKETAGYEFFSCFVSEPSKFEWKKYGRKTNIGLVNNYLFSVNKSDYVFTIRAYDVNGNTVRWSQVRYIRQKPKGVKR